MPSAIHVLGVRHHGPGSARMVAAALERLAPDIVLIEGPPDAAEVAALAGHVEMKPPVALLVYEPESPANAVYYPFAEFSPEWQALRWGVAASVPVRFIDLPLALRSPSEEPADGEDGAAPTRRGRRDPLEQLAALAGFDDGEAWWGRLIEERHGEQDPIAVFDAIRDGMGELRAARDADVAETAAPRDAEEDVREAHMRKCVRAAMKEGFERIAIICGAWHAPVLTAEAIKRTPAKADDATLKGLEKRKTTATWIPWTNDRLAMASGYGAGVVSPGWYEHVWTCREHCSERWLARVARLMRDEDLDASPASVVESVRLADALALLRGRSIAGLDELGEATLSILCHGNPLPLRVIERKLIIGQRLGEVPADVPTVPLQRDLAAHQKSLRLKVSADEQSLDLDQRKEIDLGRSRLLHRLVILEVPWGRRLPQPGRGTSTFHELWTLQWRPEFAVALIEAARWGNTVEEAAIASVRAKASGSANLGALSELLGSVLLADLPQAIEPLLRRLQDIAAVGSDLGHLMDALPPLAAALRYGNVRKTDAALIEPVVRSVLSRVVVGLPPACVSLDDDAAKKMRDRIDAVHAALTTIERSEWLDEWCQQLGVVGDLDVHGLVAGRCWRLLFDRGIASTDEVARGLGLALSVGGDPVKAAAWLEGFLAGSGMVLIHDERLLGVVDAWVSALPRATFEQVCPIARRTFATFQAPERRRIGEKIRRGDQGRGEVAHTTATDSIDAERAALVDPVLRLILGERFR